MKNVLRFTLAAIALAGMFVATGASAEPKWRWQNVVVRTNAAALDGGGFRDSTEFSAVGVESNASSPLDTTTAISLEGIVNPQSRFSEADSITYLVFEVTDAPFLGDTESGADSLSVAVQVSADGRTWGTVPNFVGGTQASTITTGNNQAHVNGVFRDHLSVNGAALANGQPVWVFKYKALAVNPAHGLSTADIFAWPYVRFVIRYIEPFGYKVSARVGILTGQ